MSVRGVGGGWSGARGGRFHSQSHPEKEKEVLVVRKTKVYLTEKFFPQPHYPGEKNDFFNNPVHSHTSNDGVLFAHCLLL